MGTFKEDKQEANQEYYPEKIMKKCVICLCSILVCMAGGTLLLWWGYEYHPTNSQLWMVPSGLILLVTPVIAWVAAVVSATCNCKVEDDASKTNELVVQAGGSVDAERNYKKWQCQCGFDLSVFQLATCQKHVGFTCAAFACVITV